MKITGVRVHLLEKELSSSMTISRGGFRVRQHCIVEVLTDEGISGLGEGIGSAKIVATILRGALAELAVGLDPTDIEGVRSQLLDGSVYYERMGSVICAASAIEMACWDIKAKALGVPVYDLIGGRWRDEVEVYASDVYWEEDVGRMVERAERILDRGIQTVKAHVGFRGPDEDTARVRALRETLGPERKLMIDLNAGYSITEADRACQLWEEFDLYWLEEPIPPHHPRELAALRSRSSIPIAAGENEFRIYGFRDLFELGAVDFAMPDVGRAGGILETKKICALAEARGVTVSPHNFSSGVLLAATLHVMASTPNTRLLEYDASDNAVYESMFVEMPDLKDGRMRIPTSPGLGVVLRDDIVQRYGVEG
jgi:L-alanine-DL-glutamate epimerase-like enolase superfamily enzyme